MDEQRLPGKAGGQNFTARDNRRSIEAVLWVLRTGSPKREKALFERVVQAMEQTGHGVRYYRSPTP